uniref:Uncharacterized protein n=1 Tax=Arundo donax TaxID=35708 RepID=A0A0A8Y2E2_ARUDO
MLFQTRITQLLSNS